MNLGNFNQTGYAVIPNFLTQEEVELLSNDYVTSQVSSNKNYSIACASRQVLTELKPKIQKVLDLVNSQTSLTVDLLTPGAMYTDTKWIDWGWHQDHESYYILQQHIDYLNFYVIIKKEDNNRSGLSIVPLDKLLPFILGFEDLIINNGANVFIPSENTTEVRSDDTGNIFTIPVNINTIAVHPELTAGDLLLLRGDVIHKTQDNTTNRIAVSIRATRGSAVISKDKLLSGCKVKHEMISKNQQTYTEILELLKQQDIVTAKDLYEQGKI